MTAEEKHLNVIKGALEPLRRYLVERHLAFQHSNTIHPKLSNLLNMVVQLSKEKDADRKKTVAVVTYAFPDKINDEIKETISGLPEVEVKLYQSALDINEHTASAKLLVYLINGLHLSEGIAWNSFEYVVDYDPNTTIRSSEGVPSRRGLKNKVTFTAVTRELRLNKEPTLQSKGKR